MPLVVVAAPRVPAIPALLAAVADAVADALALGAGDVLALHQPVDAIAASGGADCEPWVLATIHGSSRGALDDAARAAATAAVERWMGDERIAIGGAMTSWVATSPAAPPALPPADGVAS